METDYVYFELPTYFSDEHIALGVPCLHVRNMQCWALFFHSNKSVFLKHYLKLPLVFVTFLQDTCSLFGYKTWRWGSNFLLCLFWIANLLFRWTYCFRCSMLVCKKHAVLSTLLS